MSADAPMRFRYTFALANGPTRTFEVALEPRTLSLVRAPSQRLPPWTRLDFHQCPNCPLQRETQPDCPLAAELVELVRFFADFVSFDGVTVRLETPERDYIKETSVQTGVSALLGIYMVSSGCPVMRKLRPMVRFHLPFASMAETAYRAISMYLTAQYLRQRRGLTPDWELRELGGLYEQVQVVNRAFAGRLQQIELHDDNANALVILDNFANYVALILDGGVLADLEETFCAYLEAEDG